MADPTASINGYVYEVGSQKLLTGISVLCGDDFSTETNTAGYFDLTGLAIANYYDLTFFATGYAYIDDIERVQVHSSHTKPIRIKKSLMPYSRNAIEKLLTFDTTIDDGTAIIFAGFAGSPIPVATLDYNFGTGALTYSSIPYIAKIFKLDDEVLFKYILDMVGELPDPTP